MSTSNTTQKTAGEITKGWAAELYGEGGFRGFLERTYGPGGLKGFYESTVAEFNNQEPVDLEEANKPYISPPYIEGAPTNAAKDPAKDPAKDKPLGDIFSDYEGKLKYHDGTEYDAAQLRTLVTQIAPMVDWSKSAGGALDAKGDSIGFDAAEARKLFKGEITGADQVVLDMAASLARAGVTDVSKLAYRRSVDFKEGVERGASEGQGSEPMASYSYTLVEQQDDGTYAPLGAKTFDPDNVAIPEYKNKLRVVDQPAQEYTLGQERGTHPATTRPMSDQEWIDSQKSLYAQRWSKDELVQELTPEQLAKYGKPGTRAMESTNLLGARTFGNTYSGKGATHYELDFGEDGKPVFYTRHENNSDKEAILTGLSFLAAPLTAAAGATLAPALQGVAPTLGATGSKIAAGALIGAGKSALLGGNPLTGAITGGVGAGIPALGVPGMMDITNPMAVQAINGALVGGANAAITGSKVGQGVLTGAAGGVLSGANPAKLMGIDNPYVASVVNSMTVGGLKAAIAGQNITPALLQGGVNGALDAGLGAARAVTRRR